MFERRKETPALSSVVCVTNRRLVPGVLQAAGGENWAPFLRRLEAVVAARPRAVILREKDLSEATYAQLAQQVLAICRRAAVPCILHSWAELARQLGADGLHLPLDRLRGLPRERRSAFPVLGASCHSLADIAEAQQLGCHYVSLGHIYATACKPGLPPRGRELLRRGCAAARIPVYAIGGITPARLPEVLRDGAAGACVMSGFMRGDTWIAGKE